MYDPLRTQPYSDCVFCSVPFKCHPASGPWNYSGFCDAECALRELLEAATFADDTPPGSDLMGLRRALMLRAINELTRDKVATQ